ncbi:MAG: PhzF family phenazine biosynthesis protein, partial [Parvularculaceae bacterium]|nr:PhzF family phenazine biosynthesis protein [Parvularculaceae bacterium]
MTAYNFETLDVFTDRRFAGNPLAVVTDARGLSGAEMQTVTREFNLAETVFILPPDDPAHDARLRIFTIGYEMPFAGHPTVGAAIAIAAARRRSGALLLELKAGLFRVEVEERDGLRRAIFANPNLPKEKGRAPDASALEAALSLPKGAAETGAHRPRRIGAGVDYVYVKAPLAAVRAARLNTSAFEALDLDGVVGVLLYAEGGDAPDADYHVRMFAPGAGVAEDPATGSAAAALPGQIAA